MADRPDAYVRKDPGDIIRSGDWNELQIRAREELRGHKHTGKEDGTLIPRAGLEPNAIHGSLIDPVADVTVKTLTTSGNLTVNGDLKVNGKAILGDIADLLATVKGLQGDKVNRAGDTLTGTLNIQKNLFVTGGVAVGSPNPPREPLDVNGRIQAGALTIGPWPANPAAYAFVGTNALNQAEAGNYALLQGVAGGDLGVTFVNSPNAVRFRINNGDEMILAKGGLTINDSLTVGGEFIRKVRMATGLGPEDGTDNGQIVSRVLTFTKINADTALRILYCDNLRVNGNDVAARWEIRIDGQSAPGGAIFQDKYGSSGNYHEPVTILGYALGVSAGSHTIGVWVGPIPPRGVGDAHTGWNGSRWTIEVQEVWLERGLVFTNPIFTANPILTRAARIER
jgi:hypothetical protein